MSDIGVCTPKAIAKPAPKTMGEWYDEQIAEARKRVERLCIYKAKCETLGLLQHPADDLRSITNAWHTD